MARILVVEDTADLLETLIEFLQIEGYEVVGAEDGHAGLKMIREQRPDLILCDVIMPRMDGYAVIRECRSDPAIASIPFLFMSAKTGEAEVDTMRKLGADAFISKPFDLMELVETINVCLS